MAPPHSRAAEADVDAHLQRRLAVLRGGPHGPAEPGGAQEAEQQAGAAESDRGDQQVERADGPAPDRKAPVGESVRQGARLGPADQLHQLVEHEADADRRQQRRDPRLALQRAQADPLDGDTEQAAGQDHDGHGDGQWRSEEGDAGPTHIGADRVDRAVSEVDQVGDAEDQREPDRQQRIDVADDEAVDRVVDDRAHPRSTAGLASCRPTAGTCRP